jgi:hypothetical protein
MPLNLYGPMLTRSRIHRAVIAHVKLWIPHYLAEVQRQEGVRADGVTALGPTDLPLPKSWRPTPGEVRKWPEDQLPAVIFGSPGLGSGGTRKDGEGAYSGAWIISLSAVVGGRDLDTTEWLAGMYTAALRLLMVQQPRVQGLDVQGARWEDEGYDPLPADAGRSLAAGTCTFTLELGGLANAAYGPAAPTDDPTTYPQPPGDPGDDPGPFPTVEEFELDIERSPL